MAGQPISEAIRNSTRKGIGSRPDKSFSHLKPYDIKRHERKRVLTERQRANLAYVKEVMRQNGVRRFRVPFLQREKAAYSILRRVGLSINQIARAFGRSTSVVHRVLLKLHNRNNRDVFCRRRDIRKLAHNVRMRSASFRWARMLKLLSFWEAWICGEGEEPP